MNEALYNYAKVTKQCEEMYEYGDCKKGKFFESYKSIQECSQYLKEYNADIIEACVKLLKYSDSAEDVLLEDGFYGTYQAIGYCAQYIGGLPSDYSEF